MQSFVQLFLFLKEPEKKNQGFNGIRTHDLRDTGAMLYQLSYEATRWDRGQFIKELHETLHQILPEEIANSLSPKSSRLAHLYGLPKTHKATLSMRPILSATGTYNYNLAKWLEQKLKPLSINEYTITDAFAFADEIRALTVNEGDILVSYDVTALFTNVPLEETIRILVNKAFTDDWFNKTHGLNLQQEQLARLLEIATTISFSSLMVNFTNRQMVWL